MDPFWNNVYDEVKDRRYGTLFFAAILSVPLLLAVVAIIANCSDLALNLTRDLQFGTFQRVCLCMLAALVILEGVLVGRRWIRVGQKHRHDRLKYSNLSRDELLKARSKLKKQMNPVKFRVVERPTKKSAPRPPDTDLKY